MAGSYDVQLAIEGDTSGSTVDNAEVTLTASLPYTILLDDGTSDNAETVRQGAINLPQPGSSHPSNPYLFAEAGIDIQKKAVNYYTATVNYTSEPFTEGNQDISPIDLPFVWNVDAITTQEAIDEYLDGTELKPLENPITKEPIEGVTRSITDMIINIEKNVTLFDPVSFYTYYDRVNSDLIPIGSGFLPGTCKVVSISEEQASSLTIPYYKILVKIQARKPWRTSEDKAWWKRIKRQGYYEYTGRFLPPTPDFPNGRPEILRTQDTNNRDMGRPASLDDQSIRIPDNEDSQYGEYQVYESIAFQGMGLW